MWWAIGYLAGAILIWFFFILNAPDLTPVSEAHYLMNDFQKELDDLRNLNEEE